MCFEKLRGNMKIMEHEMDNGFVERFVGRGL